MFSFLKSTWFALTAGLVLVLGLLGVGLAVVHVRDLSLTPPSGTKILSQTDRISTQTPRATTSSVSFTLVDTAFSPSIIHFVPDDLLYGMQINGRDVPLFGVPFNKRSDYLNGFRLDISAYLHHGPNRITVAISNFGSGTGLSIDGSRSDATRASLFALLTFGLILVAIAVGTRRRWPLPVIAVFILAILLRIWALNATPATTRGHDLEGHLEYVDHILTKHSLPDASQGWQTYQPPLYYLLASIWTTPFSLAAADSTPVRSAALQLFSLLLSITFLYFFVETILYLFSKQPARGTFIWRQYGGVRYRPALGQNSGYRSWLIPTLGTLLAGFWPGNIIHSVRIGNDALLYPLSAAALFFALRWYREGKQRNLVMASILAMLGMLTKANAIVVIAFIAVMLLARVLRDGIRRQAANMAIFASISLIGLLLVTGPAILKNLKGKPTGIFVGNSSGLNSGLAVKNDAANYLYFDIGNFIKQPFTSPWNDEHGRQYFFNYFLKTSLFGEFGFTRPVASNLAVFISLLLLGLLAFFLRGLLMQQHRHDWPILAAIAVAFFILAAMLNRILLPFSCSNDFRYSLPVLIPFVLILLRPLADSLSKNRRLFIAGTALIVLFAVFSGWFILAL